MSIFNWFKKESENNTPTKIIRRAPAPVDKTDSMQVNAALTKGLYHNSYPGIKLGGALAYNPVAIPAQLMGFPIPTVEDNETIQEVLTSMVEDMRDKMKDIHIQSPREGTIWIFPKLSKGVLVWEFISDETISDIIRDMTTGEVIRIYTNEDIKLSIGSGEVAIVNRQRIFTKTRVSTTYSGQVPAGIHNKESRNPSDILPIPFANNADGDEVRGHSDYERIVTDLKSYHDVDLAEQTALAKFSPKMVQTVKNVDEWIRNQGYTGGTDFGENFSLNNVDVVLNLEGETTIFEFPERVTDSLQGKLKQIFRKIVEASGIPEIAWGLKTEGNLASVDENMTMLMNYVKGKQDQKTKPYTTLFSASLRLLNAAMLIGGVSPIVVSWNKLDGLSAKTKSEIFKNFAKGISKAVGAAAITMTQLHNLWLAIYPDSTAEDLEEFTEALTVMSGHVVRTRSSANELLDIQGLTK